MNEASLPVERDRATGRSDGFDRASLAPELASFARETNHPARMFLRRHP